MTASESQKATDTSPDVVELPDDLRIPLNSLQDDMRYLFGRVAADGSVAGLMADSVLERLSQIETSVRRQLDSSRAMLTALKKAAQLADIATDWDLSEVEIDGEMVSVYALKREFAAAIAKAERS